MSGDVYNFIDEVLSCNMILSTSLHGIIIGDAYEIPSYRISLSDKLIGGDFKFNDYYSSVKRKEQNIIVGDKSIGEILKDTDIYDIDIDLDLLYRECPFRKESGK